ncbi:MAG: response regulator [Gammaproteobacteria bacterium]|nr:response regulator [Gammaproteobacteria bacterium]
MIWIMERVLLVVDDEENIIRALVRLLRREGYKILTANSGIDGLELLKENEVGVILSDQRMPEMTGTEFLSRVRELYPDTVRIMLSGYTDLNSVTDAINHGAIYKFLTKPWDDETLIESIRQAFQHIELTKNDRSTIDELRNADGNRDLAGEVAGKIQNFKLDPCDSEVAQEVLENLPVAVFGVGDDGLITVANQNAQELIGKKLSLVGCDAQDILPKELLRAHQELTNSEEIKVDDFELKLDRGGVFTVYYRKMSVNTESKGAVFVLMKRPSLK